MFCAGCYNQAYMKDSIAYLPKDKQEELNFLVAEILRRLPQTEFIILLSLIHI